MLSLIHIQMCIRDSCDTFGGEKMIKIGLAATNDAAGLDNKNVSAFIELAQKHDCEVIKGESQFFEPEEAKRVANGLKDCDLIVVTVKGFTWFGECINCLLYTSLFV